jgi:hypothetical protein
MSFVDKRLLSEAQVCFFFLLRPDACSGPVFDLPSKLLVIRHFRGASVRILRSCNGPYFILLLDLWSKECFVTAPHELRLLVLPP